MMTELKNTFSWSISRDSTFRECPRKYYFQYYGYWHGWKRDAPRRTREIYVLKQLKNRAMWIGQVVHDCIARSLRNLSNGVPVLPVPEILQMTRSAMRRDFRQSRSGLYWQNPKEYCGLFEHEYDADVRDVEWRETADTVDRCLQNFYDSAAFEHLAALKPEQFLEIERLSPLKFDETEGSIKLDCATREGDHVAVWDWKTGRRESDTGLSLQMACYAYYAQQVYNTPLDRIVTRRLDLFYGRQYEQQLTDRSLQEILDYVRGSIRDMLNLLEDVQNNVAVEERFRKVEKREICMKCNFLKVCQPNI